VLPQQVFEFAPSDNLFGRRRGVWKLIGKRHVVIFGQPFIQRNPGARPAAAQAH
jgi:hypothetical protein